MSNKTEEAEKLPKPRQILIETDGNNFKVIKAEVAGTLEFVGILESILKQIKK